MNTGTPGQFCVGVVREPPKARNKILFTESKAGFAAKKSSLQDQANFPFTLFRKAGKSRRFCLDRVLFSQYNDITTYT